MLSSLGKAGALRVAAILTGSQTEGDTMTDKMASAPSVFSYSNLVHAVSGAVGSVVAISTFYPLETVRTRLQVDDNRRAKHTHEVLAEIIRDEGLNELYRGWFPVVTALCCSNFVYFYTFNSLKMKVTGGMKSTPLTDLSLAFASGVVNVLLTTPLWVANTRLKLQGAKLHTKAYDQASNRKYKGIIDCLQKIIQTEGFWSLWNGIAPSLVLVSNPAIQFMIYEYLKRYFQRAYNTMELSGMTYFFIGALAKAGATVLTYPLQVVQSRLRAGLVKAEKAKSLLQNLTDLVKHQGVGALFKGMEAKLFQTVLTAALMFVAYEKIAAIIFSLMGLAPPPGKK